MLDILECGGDIVIEVLFKKGKYGLMWVMILMCMEEECFECYCDILVLVGGLCGGVIILINLNVYWIV